MAFRLSDKRCEEIKEIVVNTFEELNIRCIPISGFEMATKLGAVVVPYSSKSEETRQLKGVRVGVIRTNGKIATVFPDSDQSSVLRRKKK